MLICVGVLMIGVSLFTPDLSLGRLTWSDQQALQYQAAAANLHHLSHEVAEASPGEQAEAVQRELKQAQAEYQRLRSQLDVARGLSGQITMIVRLLGVALAIVGTAVALAARQS
jgi:hypothetical protein